MREVIQHIAAIRPPAGLSNIYHGAVASFVPKNEKLSNVIINELIYFTVEFDINKHLAWNGELIISVDWQSSIITNSFDNYERVY